MLTGGGDAGYRAALGHGGQFQRRVEAWRGGERVDWFGDRGVPITGGSLSVDLDNRVTRRLRLNLPAPLFPATYGQILDPLQDELRVWAGWRFGADPPRMWQVFTGPVVSVSKESSSATFSLEASDRVEQIVEDKFTSPVASGAGALVTTRIMDLITDSQPGATFAQVDETHATVPALTWESDRAQAIDDLAAGVSCHWYQLPDGRYTVRLIPWGRDQLGEPVATLTEGVDLTSITVARSRAGLYTICQVSGEAANGSAPVSGTATDTNNLSPTFYLGPLGARVLQVREDSVSSVAQAESLARQRLRRASTRAEMITTKMPFDPSLELGDVIRIVDRGGASYDRALSSFTAELGTSPTMGMQWRAPEGGDLS